MFKAIVIVLIIASAGICRINLPSDKHFAIKEDSTRGERTLLKLMTSVGIIRVDNIHDYGLAKLGTIDGMDVVLLPFTEGWQVL